MQTRKDKSLDRLKQILLADDQEKLQSVAAELEDIRRRIADKESLIESLDPVLADLLERKIADSKDQMAEALAPVMGEAIRHQIRDAKEDVVDALYPVIGSTIRKSVAEAMKNLVESVNQKIDQTIRRGLVLKRIKSKITGVSEGELLVKDLLPFHIEQIFLIQKASGLLISHASAGNKNHEIDEDLISGMLTAIRDFVSDAFTSEEQELREIQYEDSKILLEIGRTSYLALVISGQEPEEFRDRLHGLSRKIHNRFYKTLRQFDGDPESSRPIEKSLNEFLQIFNTEKSESPPKSHHFMRYVFFILLALGLIFIFRAGLSYVNDKKISQAIAFKVEQNPLLKNQDIEFQVKNGHVHLTGHLSSLALKAKIDSIMRTIPAAKSIQNELHVDYSSQIKREIARRISERGGAGSIQPKFIVDNQDVIIEGVVPTLQAKREVGLMISDIKGVRIVTNNLQVSPNKLNILNEYLRERTIYFDTGSQSLSEQSQKKLDEIIQAVNREKDIGILVQGHSDNSGNAQMNDKISRERAVVVTKYLISHGIPKDIIRVESYGNSDPITSNDTLEGKSKNRRVELRIIRRQ